MRERKLAVQQWFFSATCRIILIAWIVVFGVFYVLQTTSVSTKGFEISDLERQKIERTRETKQLQAKIAEYRSMQSIQGRLQNIGLVQADAVEYVSALGSTVARR